MRHRQSAVRAGASAFTSPLQPRYLSCRNHAREGSRQSFDNTAINQLLELTATHAETHRRLTDRQHADPATGD
jgi:hypothetical protein